MTPKVSVLVKTYNHERFIEQALASVFAQKANFPFEVVVADDASTDRTREIVAGFAREHPGIVRTSYQAETHGDYGVENTLQGLEQCRGEYIALLDGDDYWIDPAKLQRQVDFLDDHPDCAMCFHNCRIEYDEKNKKSYDTVRFLKREMVTIEDLLDHAMVQTSTVLMRPALVPELRKRPDLLCDWVMGILAARTGPIAYLEEIMSVFRQHEGSTFVALDRADQWVRFMALYEGLLGVLDEKYHARIEQSICVRSYLAALEYEKTGDLRKAGDLLRRAMKGTPAWFEPYCACFGFTGEEYFQQLRERLRMYRAPMLFPLWRAWRSLLGSLRWRWLAAVVKLNAHSRLSKGASFGYILASPNPASSGALPGRAAVNLQWSSASTEAVEVRLGRPDGPLIAESSASGGTITGEWIYDRTIFYLQDVFKGLPLTQENTLDVVRIRVT